MIKQAEEYLEKMEAVPGYVSALLRVIGSSTGTNIDAPTKQAASIALKRVIRLRWDCEAEADRLCEEDRACVKANILEALCFADRLVTKQLAVALQDIAWKEYPARWPDLATKIVSFITSQNAAALLGALTALRAVVRNYEYSPEDDPLRDVLAAVVQQTFPVLEQLLDAMARAQQVSLETLQIERVVLKILWSSTNMSLPPYLKSEAVVRRWMGFVLGIIERATRTPGPNEQAQYALHASWWKAVKRASETLLRWLVRYGAKGDTKGKLRAAVKPFRCEYAPKAV
jgi:hypothetical protein